MKIFISYNHKDQSTALQIKDKLTAAGFEVFIDMEKMRAGQNIDQFILECIRDSDATLSLISEKSLLSAWVATETILSSTDEKIRCRHFLPCYIETAFFDRSFTGKAQDSIDQELLEIKNLMKIALDKCRSTKDLESERDRLLKLNANLPEIIGKFRDTLCIDLTPDHFEAGMQKIISDLQAGNGATSASPDIKAAAVNAHQELQQQINKTIDEVAKQRLETLSKRLVTQQKMLEDYEALLDSETDPRLRNRYEQQISRIKQDLEKIIDEIKKQSQ